MLSWRKKTTTRTLSVFVGVFLFSFFCFVAPAFAQTNRTDLFGIQPVAQSIALSSFDPRLIVMQIIRVALGLLGVAALVLILYAGYTIMTSGGEEEKVVEGKRILTNAVIGLAIILSAFAIVQFILNMLAAATGASVGGNEGGGVTVQTFGGTGALGRIVRDHYPFRDQTGVARNTKIAVTFNEPIDPSSIIQKRAGSTLPFGKCADVQQGQPFDWGSSCDQINPGAIQIFVSPTGRSTATPLYLSAAAMTVPAEQTSNSFTTFVFQPLQPLGNDRDQVEYTVKLTDAIKKKNGTSAFGNPAGYVWKFTTSNQFDYTPPKIESVFPRRPQDGVNEFVARNAVVQINFDKAVDPTMVQGTEGPNGTLTNMVFADQSITGEWKISNNYRTVSFVSDIPCGINSCGEQIYCLPRPGTAGGTTNETVLVRTAQLAKFPIANPQPIDAWQSIPFSGVMDMSGNALEGNRDAIPDNRPTTNNPRAVAESDKAPDNDYWDFTLTDSIDNSAPYVNKVSPGVDEGGVSKFDPIKITFGEQTIGVPMWDWTLSDIGITEYPTPTNPPIDPIWKHVTSQMNTTTQQTEAFVEHREFGPNGQNLYYFPVVPSTARNAYQNCLFPGRGPSSSAIPAGCVYDAAADRGVNCVPVTKSQKKRRDGTVIQNTGATGCAEMSDASNLAQPDVVSCVNYLSNISPPQ